MLIWMGANNASGHCGDIVDRTRLKKSETLEVRISLEIKQAFMTHCRDQGRSASEVIRDFVEGEVMERPCPLPSKALRWRVAAAAALAGVALGAVAAPTLARSVHHDRPACDRPEAEPAVKPGARPTPSK
jgi:anti-sigma factor RsiW